jgi:hypothetical protein
MLQPMRSTASRLLAALFLILGASASLPAQEDNRTLRVFIFAGQSNMVGSDSRAQDVEKFPPFAGLERPQDAVKFSYCIGREDRRQSKGWVELQPVDDVVGPELSFARRVAENVKAPIAIIKIAAGGTELATDWNPDQPSGFKLYPLALEWIRAALADLERKKIAYRLEGFFWHQGENDMFHEGHRASYGSNLKNFIGSWRRDLAAPELRFYVGELCTKTIWGMDNRAPMYAISLGQREVTDADPLAEYVPTSHVAIEIGGGAGLHYHYGTLGQLEHGVNYADAYLRNVGREPKRARPLAPWPYEPGSAVSLFVLAGHRNMEGERAFIQDLKKVKGKQSLSKDNPKIAFKYVLGGGYKVSDDWEPLGPAGFYDTFGPEISFGAALGRKLPGNVAIAKFTHSGSQILDWTLAGSVAMSRNLYPQFIAFVREALASLETRGHQVELAGIFYHLGENDMSFAPYRRQAIEQLATIVQQSRVDLDLPALPWYVSQQPPTDDESVNGFDVTTELEKLARTDANLIRVEAFDLPGQEEKIVITAPGIVALGERLAESHLKRRSRAQ